MTCVRCMAARLDCGCRAKAQLTMADACVLLCVGFALHIRARNRRICKNRRVLVCSCKPTTLIAQAGQVQPTTRTNKSGLCIFCFVPCVLLSVCPHCAYPRRFPLWISDEFGRGQDALASPHVSPNRMLHFPYNSKARVRCIHAAYRLYFYIILIYVIVFSIYISKSYVFKKNIDLFINNIGSGGF